MPATQGGSRTLSTGPVPTNLSTIDDASIRIDSIGNRDGVQSTRARRCVRENGFVGRRSSIPGPAPHSAQCTATIAASLARCEHAAGSCGHSRFQGAWRAARGRGKGTASHVARAALRRFGSSCFPWPTADGAWLPRWVADLWFVDTARPLGRSVPTWRSDLRDRVGRHAHGGCRTRAGLHSLLEPRAHLESCGTERGRGEHLSACNLQR